MAESNLFGRTSSKPAPPLCVTEEERAVCHYEQCTMSAAHCRQSSDTASEVSISHMRFGLQPRAGAYDACPCTAEL